MNYEAAVEAKEDRLTVTYNGMVGRLSELDSDGETVLAHFVHDGVGIAWVDILDVELAPDVTCTLCHPEPCVDPGYEGQMTKAHQRAAEPEKLTSFIPQMGMRELVDVVRQASWSDGGGPESEEPMRAAITEIHRRLDAIQMYLGTEATIIKLILSGQRPGS